MHIVGKENMEVSLSKLHYLWNVISLFWIFTSPFKIIWETRINERKSEVRNIMTFKVMFFLPLECTEEDVSVLEFLG